MIDFKALIEAAKESAAELGLVQYELYLNENEDVSTETFRHEIEEFSFGVSSSLSVRVFLDGKAGSASSGSVSTDTVKELLKSAKENLAVISGAEKAFFYTGGGEYREAAQCEYTMPKAGQLKDAALDLCQTLYAAEEAVSDGAACGAWAGSHRICLYNSSGVALERTGGCDGVYTYAVLSEGDEKQSGVQSAYNCLENYDAKSLCEKAIEKAKGRFGAEVPETGVYNLVLEGKQMEAILSAFTSVFFGERANRGLSPLSKKDLESKVASECVTLIDDPFMEGNSFQMPFDGEGVPTYTKAVLENGVFKTFLYNLKSAEMAGEKTTGNAARNGSNIGTKVYNFRMQTGECSREELFAKAGDGSIFVTEMKGFHAGANDVTGDFSIESAGFMIENGKKGRAVKSFTVAGNFFDLLKKITAVGNEIEEHCPGYTRHLCPDVLLCDMKVAGK